MIEMSIFGTLKALVILKSSLYRVFAITINIFQFFFTGVIATLSLLMRNGNIMILAYVSRNKIAIMLPIKLKRLPGLYPIVGLVMDDYSSPMNWANI